MSGITVTIDDEAVLLRLRTMGDQFRRSILRAVTTEAIRVQARVREKLAGPVLNERTHHLHDSIHYTVEDGSSGITARVGTNVVYAAYHEYGFSGTEQVRAHLRRISSAFGHPIATVEAMVRAYARHVHYPAHSFLRSTLAEMTPEISERLRAAAGDAVAAP